MNNSLALVLLSGFCIIALTPQCAVAAPAADREKVEVREADDKSGVKEVRFISRDGRVLRSLSFDPGERVEDGHRIRRVIGTLKDRKDSHVVVWQEKARLDQKTPTDIRVSSPVQISWYQADGRLLCEQKSSLTPRALSADGHVLIAVRPGWDPVGFELYPETPPDLRAALTKSHLAVMDQRCQVIYSGESPKEGWDVTLVSPAGRWIAIGEVGAETITVIRLADAATFSAPRASVKELTDKGDLIAWKTAGLGKSTRRGRYHGDKAEREIPRVRYRKLIWSPGAEKFEETKDEKEE